MDCLKQNLRNFTFLQYSQPFYDVMQIDIDNLVFFQGVNFELIASVKNNGTKYLLIFHVSCDFIRYSKAFIDIATAGQYRGLSTFYIKHILFHQSKFGRGVEL